MRLHLPARGGAAYGLILLLATSENSVRSTFFAVGPGGGGAELCAAIHPENADILLLGQDVGGVLKSTDAGNSWRHVNNGLAGPELTAAPMGVQELLFSPNDPQIVFAGTWGGLFRSTDMAESWVRVVPAPTESEADFSGASALAISSDGTLVLAGTGDPFQQKNGEGLYRSRDGGTTFSRVENSGIPGDAIYGGLIFDSSLADPNLVVYAATSAGLYRSMDAGLTFSKVNGGFAHENIRDIAFSQAGSDKVIWVALQTTEQGAGGVYRSLDGLTWTEASGDLPLLKEGLDMLPHALIAHPKNLSTAYLTLRHGFDFSALYRTDDAGQSWVQLTPDGAVLGWNQLWGVWSYGGAISPANPNRILLTSEAQPMLSNDGGLTWEQVGTRAHTGGGWSTRGVEVTFAYAVRDAPNHPQRLYAGYEDIGLWRSDNAGASWSPIFLNLTAAGESDACSELHVHPEEGDEFYAVAASWSNGLREPDAPGHLLHSRNGGQEFVNLTQSLAPGEAGRACAAIDFTQPAATRPLLFSRHGLTLFRSTNGGGTWAVSASGLTLEHRKLIFVLAFDPSHPHRAYAGTHTEFGKYGASGGLYVSDNGGETWRISQNYTSSDVHFIGFRGAPQRLFVSGGNVLADAFDGALEVSDDGGQTFRVVLRQPFVMDVVQLPNSPSTLLAAAGGHYLQGVNQAAGIYRSIDNGETWERLPLEMPHNGLLTLAAPSWDPQRLFVGTRGDGLFSQRLPPTPEMGIRLSIRRITAGVEISWTGPDTGAVLESADHVDAAATWAPLDLTVITRDNTNLVVAPLSEQSQYFRLR